MILFRKTIIYVVFLFFVQQEMQARLYDVTQLPIVVRNMPEWSNEYPTVINNWEGMFVNSVNGELPPLLSVVISINGKDAKGMSEEIFNDLLMSQGNSTIEYLTKNGGENKKSQCTIQYYPSIYWAEGISLANPESFPEDVEIRNIKNASVFSLNTFSYKLGEINDVDEAAILDAAGKSLIKLGFAKTNEEEKADMILILSKGRDKNNGYKMTLSIIDGKNIRKGVERVLWTLDVIDLKENMKTQESVIKTSINKMCSNFPFDQPTYSQSINTLGVAFVNEESISTGKILKVLKGSDAYEKGLRDGDAILGAYSGYSFDHVIYTKTRRYYFKPNKKDKQKNWGVDLLFSVLPVIPQFTYNNATTYLSQNKWRGGGWSKNHFMVMNNYGKKYTVYAPFENRKFNLKYIK